MTKNLTTSATIAITVQHIISHGERVLDGLVLNCGDVLIKKRIIRIEVAATETVYAN